MAELENEALEIVRKAGDRGVTCTELGEQIFEKRHRPRQSFARPAGKIMANLKRKGFVQNGWDGLRERFIFTATEKKGQPNEASKIQRRKRPASRPGR